MHETHFKMKDGREFVAEMWSFQPSKGYCTIVVDDPSDDPTEVLFFKDMESAVTDGQRISVREVGKQDELARAKEQGWDGITASYP